MMELNIHNNSDIGVICGSCGTNFTGKANCAVQLADMLAEHRKEHGVTATESTDDLNDTDRLKSSQP